MTFFLSQGESKTLNNLALKLSGDLLSTLLLSKNIYIHLYVGDRVATCVSLRFLVLKYQEMCLQVTLYSTYAPASQFSSAQVHTKLKS